MSQKTALLFSLIACGALAKEVVCLYFKVVFSYYFKGFG